LLSAQVASVAGNAAQVSTDTARSQVVAKRAPLPRPDVRGTTGFFVTGKNAVSLATTPGATGFGVATPNKNQSAALMFVGGAAFLGGLIIDDDAGTVIAIGGLIVGLYGLYNYLQ
jgi:hypothetical protein